jgi:uncharacterized membrane protein YesL
LFWDIFKNRFGKLFIINLLTLLFFIPLIALIVFRYLSVVTYGTMYPFASGFGVGFMAPVTVAGMAENVEFSSSIMFFLLLPVAGLIAGIGLSGGFYVIRNMVWTEGVFVANDFWRGIKQNAKQMILICVIYSALFYLFYSAILLANLNIAGGLQAEWINYVIIVICAISLAFISVMAMHMMTMCVTYELKFGQLIRNAFIFTIANPFSSLFFILLGGITFVLMFLGEFMLGISVILLILLGLSVLMLVWTIFSQWLYDRYVNDKVVGAKKNRGIYEKVQPDKSKEDTLNKYKEQYGVMSSMLTNKPIKPITDEDLTLAELPQVFNRADIEKLNDSRKALYDDNEKYVAEHTTEEHIAMAKQQDQQMAVVDDERLKRMESAKRELEKREKRKKRK